MDAQERLARLQEIGSEASALQSKASNLLARLPRRIQDNGDAVRDNNPKDSERIRRECHDILDQVLDIQIEIGEKIKEAKNV